MENTSLFYPLTVIIEILVIFTVYVLFLYLNSNKLKRMKVSNVNNNLSINNKNNGQFSFKQILINPAKHLNLSLDTMSS